MISKEWKLAVIGEIYYCENLYKNTIVHVTKLVHSDDYFMIIVPEFNFKIMFIEKKKIVRFL